MAGTKVLTGAEAMTINKPVNPPTVRRMLDLRDIHGINDIKLKP